MSTVDIVMSTYNAGAYLESQIASIISQTDSEWRLLIRDDGSSDQTLENIRKWIDRDSRIALVSDEGGNVGVSESYSRLLSQTRSDIIMISDQDDVWKPDRIRRGRENLEQMMAVYGNDIPLLVHSDLELVDANDTLLASSFWRYQGINPGRAQRFMGMLVQNVVTGCTMTMNRSLLKQALPIPKASMMYDWWLGLVASLWGDIRTEDEPLVCYRQHESNVLGAHHYGSSYILRKMIKFYDRDALKQSITGVVEQASCFLNRYEDRIPMEFVRGLEFLAKLDHAGFLKKRYGIIRYGLWKTGIARNIGWFLRV